MKKMIIYIIIGVIILGVIGILGYMRYIAKNSPSIIGGGYDQNLSKVVEYRDFSCPGMTGFTFKYPVFEGWEGVDLSKTDQMIPTLDESCQMKFNQESYKDSFSIDITKTPHPTSMGPAFYTDNPVSYSKSKNIRYFESKEFSVSIQVYNDPNHFPSDVFFQTVIESFKLTK